MSYIGDMRKFVGHAPIMAVAAMGIFNRMLLYAESAEPILAYLEKVIVK